MKIVSFYHDVDDSKYYTNHSYRLKQKCEKLGIESIIIEKNYGDKWIDNVKAKPLFLKEMLLTLNEDFIWLDIDSDIIKPPPTGFFSGDWMCDLRPNNTPHDYIHIIKNKKSNLEFIESWISKIEENNKGSHTAFIEIYKSLNLHHIPKGYFSIGELSNVESKNKYFKHEL